MAANSVDSDQYVDGSIDTAHIADSQITSAKIVDGTIVNADVNASAAIDATKIADGTVTSSEFQYINTLSSNAQTQIDAKAATTYVDNAVAGLRTRIIAECASTANVVISSALEAGDAIDGVTLVAGDRVLLKNQSTATENGLYIAVGSGAGAASRDPEHDTIAELSGGMVVVNQGTANDNKIFLCTTDTDATLGSTSITYTTITPQNVGTVTSITAGTGLSGGAITASGTIAIDSTVATLAGTQTLTNKTLTAPKINEDVAVTSTATELNLLDGATVVIPGKVAGTNFTDSLLVGHATTGTLNAAARNTGIGIGAMDAITSGDDNTVIGRNAGSSITSGYSNTYIGQAAGNSSTTSRQNVAVGSSSLLSVTTGGHENTAVGLEALKSVNSGDHNVGIGWKAGDSLTSGKGNVLIGSNVEAASNTGDRQLTIGGYDGTNTTTWITGDSSGNLITPGTITANGVVLAAGGTDWQSITTGTTLTTVAGRGYPINTTSNGCTVTLPSSASVGDSISIVDYAGTFATNNIILTSSLKINGATNDKSLKTNREGVTVTYVDATQGWVATSGVNSGDQALDTVLVDFLVIAGGGSGGYSNGASGGAGGYRNSYSTETSGGGGSSEAGLTFNTGTSYTITVGAGGASKTSDGGGNSGTNSSISGTGITTITSIGGGAGGNVPTTAGLSGGSGGGAGTSAGSGTANQGFNGGAVPNGGGGGAGEAGNTDGSKHGGDGLASSITGSSITRGGGGGDPGGDGGGGDASTAGTANTGGGGGWFNGAGGGSGAGGSGVVILRMPTSLYSGTTSGSPTVSTSGIYTILIYNASGSYTA